MKCSFSRLLYPKTVEEARDGSYMIALFRPCLLYTSPGNDLFRRLHDDGGDGHRR